MPALGMAQDTGKVLQWLKTGGEQVAEGEPLVEIETDKATVEIEAPASGTLAEVSAAEGVEVAVGTVIALVLAPGEIASAEQGAAGEPGQGEVRETEQGAAEADGRDPGGLGPDASTAAGSLDAADPWGGGPAPLASPKARRLARARGVDLGALTGSGPGGAVVASDIEQAAGDEAGTAPVAGEGAAATQVGTVWRVMAERTQRSWQDAPQFVLRRDIDASQLVSWKSAARGQPGCEAVTHTDLLVKVCAETLRRHPRVNASWSAGAIVTGDGVNVAIAVATEDGLVAPVLHDADQLDLAAISARRKDLVEAARTRRLRPKDLEGATFTISNLGMYGVDSFQAIVDSPQAAILAVGRMTDRPFALNGEVVVRPALTLSVSFDHRAVDGARGAEFLDTLASLLEQPAELGA